MVNQVVLDYLKKNKKNYELDVLKKEILSKGYSEDDFSSALDILNEEDIKGKEDSRLKPASVTRLPSSSYVNDNKERKGIGIWLFFLLLFLLLVLGVGVVFLFNFLGYDFFGFNILDFF